MITFENSIWKCKWERSGETASANITLKSPGVQRLGGWCTSTQWGSWVTCQVPGRILSNTLFSFLWLLCEPKWNYCLSRGVCPPHGASPAIGFWKEPCIELGCRPSGLHYLWDTVSLASGEELTTEGGTFPLSVWKLMRASSGPRRLGLWAWHGTRYTQCWRILKQQAVPMRPFPVLVSDTS